MRTEKLSAIMMAVLIVMMPMIYADTSTFDLSATVPTATKDNSITITGTTKANIDVVVSVNKARVAEITSDSSGEFSTSPITLVREDNSVTIRATDGSGSVKTLTYNVKIDNTPPAVVYTNVPTGSQIRATTISGTTSEPVTIDWKTNNVTYKSVPVKDSFSFSIDLEDGMNNVEFIAKDSAGNEDKQTFEIMYDIAAPNFLLTNLDGLDNCYLDFPAIAGKKVDITGQVNEKSTIFVYVNHESNPSKVRTTDDTGYFRVKDVILAGKLLTNTSSTQTTIQTGNQYQNHIRIVAKDLAGNEDTIEKTITCSTCGGGASGYTFNTVSAIQAMMPSTLLPKLLINGIETITMPFNISYTGMNDAVIRNIKVTPVIMGPEYADKYDNDKITAYVLPQFSRKKDTATGIIQIKIQKFDPLGAVESDATQYRREYNVSHHRYGKCAIQLGLGGDLNYGCMRFFLMLEIQYQETSDISYLDPNVRTTAGPTRENKVQKICISNIEAPIDIVTGDYVPKKLVRKWIKNIDHILKKVEPVQEMLDTATEYATYTCIGSAATLALTKLAELTTCQIGEWIAAAGDAKWHSEIAETGMCDLVYHEDFDKEKDDGPGIKGNQGARRSCNSCSSVIGLRKWIEYEVMHRACDRVGCPAAKTFKSYIRDKGGSSKNIKPLIIEHYNKAQKSGINTDGKIQDLLFEHGIAAEEYAVYTGSDCGFVTNPRFITPTYGDVSPAKGIKSLYLETKKPETRDYCTKYLRAAKPECCGIEYEREWSSACGVGKTFGVNPILLDTFDELKESTCYAARQAGDPKATGTGIDCSGGMLWNAMAGFCEANTGDAVSEVIYTGMNYKPTRENSEDNRVYVFVKPVIKAKEEVEDFQIFRGYAIKKVAYEASKDKPKDVAKLTQGLYEVHDVDLTSIFKSEANDKSKKASLKNKLCGEDKKGYGVDDCKNIDKTYNRIVEIIGTGDDKEYIVRADTGLLRSIQCICFPAVKAWVDQWVTILTMLRNCLATVEIGKGDAGVCDQFLSQVVCDRIYDILKCFSGKLGWSGVGTRVSGDFGLGSIVGLLTNTASEMSKTMNSRYGESSMWTSLFNERDLVHGVCMFAFTGKYDLQIEQIVQHATEDIAIESQPFISECKRYFRGYSPTSSPSGLTTWAYECGMAFVSGAEVNYEIKLQCSDDFSCSEADGYRNNECDCVESGKKQITLERGTLKRGESFNKKFLWPIQAGTSGSKYRYDTAIIYYEWEDPKTKEKRSNSDDLTTRYIGQGGSPAFGFCSFDPFTVAYRCQFGKQEGGIAIKKIKPDYDGSQHPTKKTKAFYKDQDFTFDAQVKQRVPDTPSEQQKAKKYLFYKIINHARNIVYEIKPEDGDSAVHIFESHGDYTDKITIDNSLIDMEIFLKQKPGETLIAQREKDGIKKTVDASDYISDYEILKVINATHNAPTSAIVEMTSEKIAVYHVRSKIRSTFYKGDVILAEHEIKEGPLISEPANSVYKIRLNIEKIPEPQERVQIYIPVSDPRVKSPWASGDPADWKIIFTLYDANKFGETSEQVTISPAGELQIKEVPFKVINTTIADGGKTFDTGPARTITVPSNYQPAINDKAILSDPKILIKVKAITPTEIKILRYDINKIETIPADSSEQFLVKLIKDDVWPTIHQHKVKIHDLIPRRGDKKGIAIDWVEHPSKKGTPETIPIGQLDIKGKLEEVAGTQTPSTLNPGIYDQDLLSQIAYAEITNEIAFTFSSCHALAISNNYQFVLPHHCIDNATKPLDGHILLQSNSKEIRLELKKILAELDNRDLAIITTEETKPLSIKPVSFSNNLQKGMNIKVVPSQTSESPRTKIITGKIIDTNCYNDNFCMLLTSEVKKGDSGSVIVNDQDEVLGILSFKVEFFGGKISESFGVKSKYIQQLMSENNIAVN